MPEPDMCGSGKICDQKKAESLQQYSRICLYQTFLFPVSRDDRVTVCIDSDHTTVDSHIPFFSVSSYEGIVGIDFCFAPADHIIRLEGKISYDAQYDRLRKKRLSGGVIRRTI